jgi:hypothetical protein
MQAQLCAVAISLALSQTALSQMDTTPGSPSGYMDPELAEDYGSLPLSFEANQGQTGSPVKFLSRGNGYVLFLTDHGAVLALTPNRRQKSPLVERQIRPDNPLLTRKNDSDATNRPEEAAVVRMELIGATHRQTVEGVDQLPGTANYFVGNDPAKWNTSVPLYKKVRYPGVYPGVDLVYYGNRRQLEYDFVVAPNAGTRQLRLKFDGATAVALDASGDLEVKARNGEIVFRKPVVSQLGNGRRRSVAGRFRLLPGNAVGFNLGSYDHHRELLIDPTLAYVTYLGGSMGDFPSAIAVDAAGSAYITGGTESIDFPVSTGAYNAALSTGNSAAFITKLNPAGTAIVYSTYLGGAANDSGATGTAIAVDNSGKAYVAGTTYANDFPVTSAAFETTPGDNVGLFGASFVAKLNSTGTALVYSTYLGGSLPDLADTIAVDSLGDAFVAGQAESPDFPITPGVAQPVIGGPPGASANAFVTKFNPAGSALLYSTYLGGNNFDGATGIALDANDDAYVTGQACSTNFPVTSGALQTVNGGALTYSCNAYVTKFNPAGSALVYSTYLGGSGSDGANAIAVDPSENAYVTGYSFSSNFPVTAAALQPFNNAAVNQESNAFIAKLNPAGSALIYSTYLGGSGFPNASTYIEYGNGDTGTGIALDSLGDAFVTGAADSGNFPVTASALQMTNSYAQEGQSGDAAAFLTEIDPAGVALVYSTYLAGSAGVGEEAYGIATDIVGNPYIAGISSSSNLPVTPGAYQLLNKGLGAGITADYTGFVAKFAFNSGAAAGAPTITSLVASPNPQAHLENVALTSFVAAGGVGVTGIVAFTIDAGTPIDVTLDNTGHASYSVPLLTVGTHSITASYAGVPNTYLASAAATNEFILPVTSRTTFAPAAGNYNLPQSVTLYTPTPGATIYHTLDGSTPSIASTAYAAPVLIPVTATLRTMAVASGHANSEILTQVYTITPLPAAPPAFSPASGTYTTSKQVSLADSTAAATIYYTLDGSNPTNASTKYKASFTVPATTTVKAMAAATSYLNSPVSTGTYIILIHTTTALTSSPNPSVVGQAVTLTARVTPSSGPVPTGTVTFSNAGVGPLGTATLQNGVATLVVSTLGQGTATISATYNTSAVNWTSTSSGLKQIVNK